MIVCCECDWGLGAPLPPHTHMTLEHVRKGDREFWVPGPCKQLNPVVELLAVWDGVILSVDWKRLYRDVTTVPAPRRRGSPPNREGCQSRLYGSWGVLAKCWLNHGDGTDPDRHSNGYRSWTTAESIATATRFGREVPNE